MPSLPERSLRRALIVLGSLLWIALAFFSFVVPQTPGRITRSAAALIGDLRFWSWIRGLSLPISQNPEVVALMLGVFGGLAFLIYSLAVFLCWRTRVARSTTIVAFCVAVGLFATSVFAFPNFNGDIYNYMVQGRLTAVHGSNPHYVAVDEFPEDPIYPYASRQYTSSPRDYLPAWTILNAGLAASAGDDPVRALLTYRMAFLILSTANLLLIVGILRRIAPTHVLTGVVVYGWHPVVALEGQSRVDTAMAFFLLLGILAFVHRRRLAAVASLTLSVFTKWITLPLLGLYFLRSVRERRWKRLAVEVAVSASIAALIYMPFVQDMDIFRLHLGMLLRGGSSAPESAYAQRLLQIGFVGLILGVSWAKREDDSEPLWGWAVAMLAFVAFLSKIGYGWYLIVPTAVVSLVPDWRVVTPAIALGLAALGFQLHDSTFNSRFPFPDIFDIDRFWIFLLMSSVTAGGAAIVGIVRRRRAPRR